MYYLILSFHHSIPSHSFFQSFHTISFLLPIIPYYLIPSYHHSFTISFLLSIIPYHLIPFSIIPYDLIPSSIITYNLIPSFHHSVPSHSFLPSFHSISFLLPIIPYHLIPSFHHSVPSHFFFPSIHFKKEEELPGWKPHHNPLLYCSKSCRPKPYLTFWRRL